MSVAERPETATWDGPYFDGAARKRQVRRAWLFLALAVIVGLLLTSGAVGAGYWYRGHATERRVASIDVVQGDRAFIRGAQQRNWNAVPRPGVAVTPDRQTGQVAPPATLQLHEGETLRTEEGTRVLLRLWDGSTVEVFERTQIAFEELRTTQYISRAKTVSIRQTRGLLRVAIAPGDYNRARFQVVAGEATVLMRESAPGGSGGSFLVEVTLDQDGESIAQVRASVRRGAGTVSAAGQEVQLKANEQTVVPRGAAPAAPTAARRDLVANGSFTPASEDPKWRFAPWEVISTPGQRDGGFGRLSRVRETIDGRPVEALELYRSLDSTDPAVTGLRQRLDVVVADLVSLYLTGDIKVLEQNVLGGGVAGSEFPLIVRISYRDETGAAREAIRGFYVEPDPSGAKPANGQLVAPGEWVNFEVDLRALVPQPVRLDMIEVYASGHGYRARIANVSIVGTE